jgi:hypothetical protein
MLCGDDYEHITITHGDEAALFGCDVGDIVVVRMWDGPLPETLVTPGGGLLISLEPGGLVLGLLSELPGQRLVTSVSGSHPYDPASVRGIVVSQFRPVSP